MEGVPRTDEQVERDFRERIAALEARTPDGGQVRQVAPTPGNPAVVEAADTLLLVDGSNYVAEIPQVYEVARLVSPDNDPLFFTLTIGAEETVGIAPAASGASWDTQKGIFISAVQSALANLPITEGNVNVVESGFRQVDIEIGANAPNENIPDMELTGDHNGGSVETLTQGVPGTGAQAVYVLFPQDRTGFVVGQKLTVVVTARNEDAGATEVIIEADGDGQVIGPGVGQGLIQIGASSDFIYLEEGVWLTTAFDGNP